MCKKIDDKTVCDCEWILIASWTIMIKGDLVTKFRYQCKCCGEYKIEE